MKLWPYLYTYCKLSLLCPTGNYCHNNPVAKTTTILFYIIQTKRRSRDCVSFCTCSCLRPKWKQWRRSWTTWRLPSRVRVSHTFWLFGSATWIYQLYFCLEVTYVLYFRCKVLQLHVLLPFFVLVNFPSTVF